MITLNTNLASMIVQSNLQKSTNALNTAIERMTSGYKINGAKDNAANYSITTNMSTKIGAYQVAEDNVAMGLDLLSTASENLDLISDKLTRLRALAEQSANGTYGEQSLEAIKSEANALTDEIFRTKNNAEYNGEKIFGETVGPDMSRLRINSEGFIEDIQKRDTSSMTSIGSVNESSVLAKGSYCISSAEELAKLARMQNAGKITAGSEFVLSNDIDLSSFSNWTPIGWEDGKPETSKAFSGIFDGNGYVISNLTSTKDKVSAVGLFGSVGDAEFKNVGIKNAHLEGGYIGSLVGYVCSNSTANIKNSYIDTLKIQKSSDKNIGGLIGGGFRDDTVNVLSCYSKNVSIKNSFYGYVGGIIGASNYGTIENCFAVNFDLSGRESYQHGIGMFGVGTVNNCYANGKISDNSLDNSGGCIGGITSGDITASNCYFEGLLYSTGKCIAGGIVSNCNGGFGRSNAENCIVNATIIARDVGGIHGMQDCNGGYIRNCHFNGTLQGTGNIGAIDGYGAEGKVVIENCTYNKDLNGELPAIGDGLGTAKNVTDRVRLTDLQVGIHSDNNSQISLDTFFDLSSLFSIAFEGINCENSMEIIDNVLLQVSAKQTSFGAVQNRLESSLEEISTQYENLVSSRSTLRDADIAEVSSEYIRQQILQQASATLLATANQSPALALQLI